MESLKRTDSTCETAGLFSLTRSGEIRGLCAVNDFTFIDHSGIVEKEHLLKDGVHLNSAVWLTIFLEKEKDEEC